LVAFHSKTFKASNQIDQVFGFKKRQSNWTTWKTMIFNNEQVLESMDDFL